MFSKICKCRKFLFLLLIIFCSTTFFYSQENDVIKNLREKMITNIKLVNDLKKKLLDASPDNINDYYQFKDNGLEVVDCYNDKKIMYKEIVINEIDIPTSVLHRSFVDLLLINPGKIYISDLILMRNNVYYFVGIKNEKRFLLLLFKLQNQFDYEKSFAVINSKGEIFYSKGNLLDKIKIVVKKINDSKTDNSYYTTNNIKKFKFFPQHDIFYFIE